LQCLYPNLGVLAAAVSFFAVIAVRH